ncbi:MAG: EAL domain-containing protein [Burkholderiaceae bacterium]|nr:EAL domain-containing protein [Burkholderiaceae bacterium]
MNRPLKAKMFAMRHYAAAMSNWLGLNGRLAIAFIGLAVLVQWMSYQASSDLRTAALQKREVDKINTISQAIGPQFRSEGERVNLITQLVLTQDGFVSSLLGRGPDRTAAIAKILDHTYQLSRIDVLEITDEDGVVLYRAHEPGRSGDLATGWGVAEALAGKGNLATRKTANGPVILSVEPIFAGGKIIGTVSAGTQIDNKFIHALSAEVGAELALLARSGVLVASSNAGKITPDAAAVTAAFQEKIPIYREDEARHTTQVYLPVLIVDEGWIIMASLDSTSAFALMKQGDQQAMLFTLLFVGGSMLITVIILRFALKPLGDLRLRAEKIVGEMTGRANTGKAGDDIVSLVKILDQLTELLLNRNRELKGREERFRALIEWSPESIAVHRGGKLLYVNPAALKLTGAKSEQDLIGKPILDLIHPSFRQIVLARLNSMTTQNFVTPMLEEKFLKLDGTTIDAEVQSILIVYDGALAVYTSLRDITERKHAEEKLRLAAGVFTYAHEGIMITTADGAIIDVNEAFSRITGYSRVEALGQNPHFLSSGRQGKEFYAAMWRDLIEKGHWNGEVWNQCKNGALYIAMQTVSAVRDAQGKTRQYVALFSDITALKEHEDQLDRIAHYDALTGLPNRLLLADRLHQAMAQAQRHGQQLAVVFLDLDGFKTINDNHGHDAGDQLLIALSVRMKQALRDGDTLARIGGDEFVAVLLDLADVQASVPMLDRLLAAAAHPVHFDNLVLQVSASLGVSFYPQAEDADADLLLRQADQSMYQAKLAGKNRYHVFDAEQDRSVRGHHESVERIRRAMNDREFVLYYQPKVNMRKGTVIGAEALIRWQHPGKGLLAPADFLPVIEDHPLAIDIGEWVIDTALTQMELWHAGGLDIPVSVNIGARQLQQANFVERLHQILAAHRQVKPSCLELEVLETSALEDLAHVSQVIGACREIGVTFALDDFGTGYSSLTYLKRLPVTLLKIDQSFVRGMLDDPDDLAILEGVIGLASAFRREVIAEGVETIEHGAMLLQLGCELAQGYGIARPMPAHELPGWSAAWRPDPAWANLPFVRRDDFPLLFASVEHRAWIKAMENHLKGEREAPPALDHQQCHFGQWLQGDGLARHGTQPSFAAIDALHRQAHVLATELCELHARGRSSEALARLGELQGLRDALLEQVKTLVQKNRRTSS